MLSKFSFVLWFISSYVVFLLMSSLVAIYGFEFRTGMEFQFYSATYALAVLFILNMTSAVVGASGFITGVILSKCNRERWIGILLGVIYGALALCSMLYSNFIVSFFGAYTSILIWTLWFLGGLILPFLVSPVTKLTSARKAKEQ